MFFIVALLLKFIRQLWFPRNDNDWLASLLIQVLHIDSVPADGRREV